VDFLGHTKNVRINNFVSILISLHVSESPLYIFKLQLTFYFLQCMFFFFIFVYIFFAYINWANFTVYAVYAYTARMHACNSLIHAGTAGHSVGRDIPGMTHGAHLRLVGDETSLFINVGRRGTRQCVSSLLRLRNARKRDKWHRSKFLDLT